MVSINFANSRQERILLLTYLKLHRKHFTFLTLFTYQSGSWWIVYKNYGK